MHVTLHNPGRRVIKNVFFRMNPENQSWSKLFYQVDQERLTHGPESYEVELGDLQPHQRRIVHIWTTVDFTQLSPHSIGNFLNITADEFDKRPMTFPLPDYLRLHQDAVGWRAIRWIFAGCIVGIAMYYLLKLFH